MVDEVKITTFDLICPECGVGNPEDSRHCIVCDKNLEHTLLFLEEDAFDLEITRDSIIEYRKNFWGTERTGKVKKYDIDKIENIEFGSPISRFIFICAGKREVLPVKRENLAKLKLIIREIVDK